MKNLKLLIMTFLITLAGCKKGQKNEVEQIKTSQATFVPTKSINPEEEILSSSFVINEESRWQLISSSQNYGCNYAIYAKFFTTPSQNIDEVIITRAEFMLLNYKNLLYMGLEDVFFDADADGLFLKIHVKAFGKYHGYPNDMNGIASNSADGYKLEKNNLEFTIKDKAPLRARRVLLPMHQISLAEFNNLDKDYRFKSEYRDSQNPSRTKVIYAKSNDRKVFDDEFFYKDGIYVKVKEDYDSLGDGKIKIMSPDTRCRDALFEIVVRK